MPQGLPELGIGVRETPELREEKIVPSAWGVALQRSGG